MLEGLLPDGKKRRNVRRPHKKRKTAKKRRVGGGGGGATGGKVGGKRFQHVSFRDVIKHARAAIRGQGIKSSKSLETDRRRMRSATMAVLKAVRRYKKGKLMMPTGGRRGRGHERILPLPKSGGLLPLLPIFAGLSALGSLAGGAAGVAKAINETREARKKLAELQRHDETMEAIALRKGKGLFLRPYKKGLGLYMMPYAQYSKNC